MAATAVPVTCSLQEALETIEDGIGLPVSADDNVTHTDAACAGEQLLGVTKPEKRKKSKERRHRSRESKGKASSPGPSTTCSRTELSSEATGSPRASEGDVGGDGTGEMEGCKAADTEPASDRATSELQAVGMAEGLAAATPLLLEVQEVGEDGDPQPPIECFLAKVATPDKAHCGEAPPSEFTAAQAEPKGESADSPPPEVSAASSTTGCEATAEESDSTDLLALANPTHAPEEALRGEEDFLAFLRRSSRPSLRKLLAAWLEEAEASRRREHEEGGKGQDEVASKGALNICTQGSPLEMGGFNANLMSSAEEPVLDMKDCRPAQQSEKQSGLLSTMLACAAWDGAAGDAQQDRGEVRAMSETGSLECSCTGDERASDEASCISLDSCAELDAALLRQPFSPRGQPLYEEAEEAAAQHWVEEMVQQEDRRVRAELAEEAERCIEEASFAMEDMAQRMACEESHQQEEAQRWRAHVRSCRAECQHWEEVASRASNEAAIEGACARKAQEQARLLSQSMEEGKGVLAQEVYSRKAEERQRWLALEAWQAADDAKTSMRLELRQMEADKCRFEEELLARTAVLEEQILGWKEEESCVRQQQLDEEAECQAATLALQQVEHRMSNLRQETAASRVEHAEKRVCHVMSRCVGSKGSQEARDLLSQLKDWTDEAQEQGQQFQRQAEASRRERRLLQVQRAEVRGLAEALEAEAVEAAAKLAREEQAKEEAQALTLQRREEPVHPPGCLLSNVPLAVRIPSFEVKKEGLSSRVVYTVVVEGPGKTETLERHFGEFRELHEQLNVRPFASSLQARPQDWFFAHFSAAMLERQRRQLEAYLAFLCAHSHVLLDGTIWRWLAVDDLTQVAARMVAACEVKWANEVCRLAQSLEAVIAAGGDESLCVHPSVLRVLRAVLLDGFDKVAQAAACRVLERLLTGSRRARQLFLAPEMGGASALAQLAKTPGEAGSAAAEAAWRILEVLSSAEADLLGKAEEAERRACAEEICQQLRQSSSPRPGECCVCLDRGKSHAFLPCGHLCACMDCAAYLAARALPCPACRSPIERAVQIFT